MNYFGFNQFGNVVFRILEIQYCRSSLIWVHNTYIYAYAK